MASTNNKILLPEFESIKDDKEEILWTGKPKFIPFIFTGVLGGLATLAFAVIWLLTAKNWNANSDNNSSSYFWLFGLIPLIVGAFTFLVSVVEKMYNVGTVRFFSGRTQTDEGNTTKLYDSWSAIENPYEVFKMVKQTSVNIKTDSSPPDEKSEIIERK